MDYHRIYREFIADRKAKPKPNGYTERHHILPRSLGGGDGSNNLIDLTAEDHFFAHLLLAKIHGGRMWAPIAFMVKGQRKHYRPIQSRKGYGWASRAMAEAMSGRGAHQYDHTTYHLEHVSGERWSGNQADMPSLGFSRAMANLLVKGRCRTAKGWYLAGQRPARVGRGVEGKAHGMADAAIRVFRHVDGRTFVGTQIEFREATGVSKAGCTGLIKGNRTVSKGWHLDGVTPSEKGRARSYL